jgi:hypothetical protein
LGTAKEKTQGMKAKAVWLVVVSSLLLACDRADQQPVVQPEIPLQQSAASPALPAEPVSVEDKDTATLTRLKKIDTSITPEMVKNIRFDAISDAENAVYNDKPLNLNPAGSTRVSVTPKLFFKEELDLKQNYMDNIEGAAVQVEMKFD